MIFPFSIIPRLDELPQDVAHEFTYGGRVELFPCHFNPIDPEKPSKSVWTKELIHQSRLEFRNNSLFGNYGKLAVQEIARHIDMHMTMHVSSGH